MRTYQDLIAIGEDDNARGEFCRSAVEEFKGSSDYRLAKDGEAYYNKHNVTIENFQKFLYTISGNKVPDIFSANYRLKTLFFRRLVIQQVQYVLGNGLKLENKNNKAKLGRDFDFQLQTLAKRALAEGRAFGFWNYDHLEVFGYADTPTQAGFCPLYNEETSQLDAGIRFWYKTVGNELLERYTLYEIDGITEYSKLGNGDIELLKPKTAYKITTKKSNAGGVEDILGENYTKLPIVPMYSNDSHETELVGIRESIDCYDFIKSGLANDIDDTSGFYWILKNTGGMDDVDLAKFVQRMKTIRATYVDGDSGVEVEPHTLAIPTEARKTLLDIIETDIYKDFQSLNIESLSASAKTTQEIQSAYQSQDNKCADFEYYVLDFVQQILELAGIDDNPTFTWNRVVNQAEQTQMILQASQYLTDEAVIKHLPFLTPEEADQIIKDRDKEDFGQFEIENEIVDRNENVEPEEINE